MCIHLTGRILQQLQHQFLRGNRWRTKLRLVKPFPNGIDGVDFQMFSKPRFVVDQ